MYFAIVFYTSLPLALTANLINRFLHLFLSSIRECLFGVNTYTSLPLALTASSCTSQSSRFNCIALGAIIMASIIVSRLISIIGISLLVLVLLVALMGVPGMKRDC